MDGWTQQLFNLLSAAVGALAALGAVMLSNKSAVKREAAERTYREHRARLDVLRPKAEELHSLLHQWSEKVSQLLLEIISASKKRRSKHSVASETTIGEDFGRLQVLIHGYFQEMSDAFDDANTAALAAERHYENIMNDPVAIEAGEVSSELQIALIGSVNDFQEEIRRLQSQVAQALRELR